MEKHGKKQIQTEMESLIEDFFRPTHLELMNESDNHSGSPGRESHFKLILVSSKFDGLNRVARSRLIYKELAAHLSGPVHALSMHLYTPEEWSKQPKEIPSPNCQKVRGSL